MPARSSFTRITAGKPIVVAMLEDHWAATEANWVRGRRRLHWLATFADDAQVAELARRVCGRLTGRGLRAVGRRWLHMTVHDVAIDGELSDEAVRQLVAGARPATLLPLRLELGPPSLGPTAVLLPAADARALDGVREALRAADDRLRGRYAQPLPTGPAAHPHVTLAYATQRITADVPADVGESTVEVEIRSLALVRLRRDYVWEELARISP